MRVLKTYKPLGKFLRKKRLERSLTQEELAKLAGCSRSTISCIERCQYEVPRYTRNMLVGALKLNRDEIKEFDNLLADVPVQCNKHAYGYTFDRKKERNITDDFTLAITRILQYLNVGQKSEIYRYLKNDLGL